MDETVTPQDINDILEALGSTETFTSVTDRLNFDESPLNIVNDPEVKRQSTYLQHSIFNSCHSETDLVRYMKTLENKDVSLVHSMVSFLMHIYVDIAKTSRSSSNLTFSNNRFLWVLAR